MVMMRQERETAALDSEDDVELAADELQRVESISTPDLDAGVLSAADAAPAAHAQPTVLVLLGALCGIMLTESVGWMFVVGTIGHAIASPLIPGADLAWTIAVVLSPLLWMGCALLEWRRPTVWVWALIGVLLLFPWPLIAGFIGGAN